MECIPLECILFLSSLQMPFSKKKTRMLCRLRSYWAAFNEGSLNEPFGLSEPYRLPNPESFFDLLIMIYYWAVAFFLYSGDLSVFVGCFVS